MCRTCSIPTLWLMVTLLGTGSVGPRISRFGPSILIEAGAEKLLFDPLAGLTPESSPDY